MLDDDCEIAVDALSIFVHHLSSEPGLLTNVGAYFGITEFAGPKDFWFKALEGTDIFADFSWAQQRMELPWGPTSLAIFNVAAVRKSGGFDETIDLRVGGEDVDVCIRLRKHGYRLRGIPKVLAMHTSETWCGTLNNLRRNFSYGAGEFILVERWPEFRAWDRQSLALMFCTWSAVGLAMILNSMAPWGIGISFCALLILLTLGEAIVQANETTKPPIQAIGLAILSIANRCGYCVQAMKAGRLGLLFMKMDSAKLAEENQESIRLGTMCARWAGVPLAWGFVYVCMKLCG
jgi:hypothetical protein